MQFVNIVHLASFMQRREVKEVFS